jgi:hypothetical protein
LRLWYTRWRHEGNESPEEDAILDEMDEAWWKLSEEGRSLLTAEGPRCWPMDPSCWPPPLPEPGIAAPKPWTYGEFRSTEEAILDADAA